MGVEQPAKTQGKTQDSETGAAKSGAVGAPSPTVASMLAALASMTPADRAALVEALTKGANQGAQTQTEGQR